MLHCPVGVWVIEQHAIILSATVRSPTVILQMSCAGDLVGVKAGGVAVAPFYWYRSTLLPACDK